VQREKANNRLEHPTDEGGIDDKWRLYDDEISAFGPTTAK
jgi:hypothetical protein